ncbi:MAG: UDP-2,4-diacetamido-2,4,6-trideoxy-beta-L-altropyranose hydrolase [Vampirovibrionales bacterium]|nr:UDP-2,4-diacetamido-2,4,6-trideoxy-beta-L-altropyranose hydrolase [Vampirovibrionales bacterium]
MTALHVAFRLEANPQTGTGHWMRCNTLAQALKTLAPDCKISVLTANTMPEVVQQIQACGHTWVDLNTVQAQTIALNKHLRPGSPQDAQRTLEWLQSNPTNWLVIDQYQWALATEKPCEQQLVSNGGRLMIIDDLADRPHCGQLLLDQNQHATPEQRYANLISPAMATLFGPRYALLRPEFAQLRDARAQYAQPARPCTALLSLGGSDPDGVALKLVEWLSKNPEAQALHWTIVGGFANQNADALQTATQKLMHAQYVKHLPNMAQAMATHDVMLTAGGTTTWERLCLGVPALVVAIAANQIELCEAVAAERAQLYLGEARLLTETAFLAALAGFINAPQQRQQMAEAGMALVDGLGAHRVARRLLEP